MSSEFLTAKIASQRRNAQYDTFIAILAAFITKTCGHLIRHQVDHAEDIAVALGEKHPELIPELAELDAFRAAEAAAAARGDAHQRLNFDNTIRKRLTPLIDALRKSDPSLWLQAPDCVTFVDLWSRRYNCSDQRYMQATWQRTDEPTRRRQAYVMQRELQEKVQ